MTSCELHHGFGFEGYRTVATRFEEGKVIFEVESTRPARCAVCESVIGPGCDTFRAYQRNVGCLSIEFNSKEICRVGKDIASVRLGGVPRGLRPG